MKYLIVAVFRMCTNGYFMVTNHELTKLHELTIYKKSAVENATL